MSALSEFPKLVRDMGSRSCSSIGKLKNMFLTTEKNNVGVYGIKFHIRGKPWVIDVDDKLLFKKGEFYS